MTDNEAKVVAAWKQAAVDLGIRVTAPFVLTLPDGNRQEYLGLIHQFGRKIGTIISVFREPSENMQRPDDENYFRSILGSGYGKYDRQVFIDTLDDWQFFGSESEKPNWYTGKSWT